ncbi:MAG: sensor histidine kinase [Acidimicrobiales bacterium]
MSIVGFVLMDNSTNQQEHTLLLSDSTQASLYVSSVFSGVSGTLDSLATAVKLTNGDPTAFAQQADPVASRGTVSLALAQQQGTSWVVRLAAGRLFTVGQPLPAFIAGSLGFSAPLITTPSMHAGKVTESGFAVTQPLLPAGEAVLLEYQLNPFVKTPITAGRPFGELDVALYGAPRATTNSLLVATSQLPITGDIVTDHPVVGNEKWTMVSRARTQLVGNVAEAAPIVVLILGLVIALVVAATIEVLDRRHRYAAAVVAERTADLNSSLDELKDAQRALVRGERLTALGEMATVVGHELRNPLAAVTNALYLLRSQLGDPLAPGLDKHLSMAERETIKAASLAEDLTAFVRPRIPSREDVPLADLVREVAEAAPPPDGVELALAVDAINARIDRRQFSEVLTNLVTNAYQALGDRGRVEISAGRNGNGTVLAVCDSGPGIDTTIADRMFEPFFTTKHDGTGLGLAIVRRLVEAHGGDVRFENIDPGPGTRIVIHLPDDGPGQNSRATAGGH